MNFLERQLEDPIRFARIKRWFYVGLVVVALAETVVLLMIQLLPHVFDALNRPALAEIVLPLIGHGHSEFENYIPAWGSLYGLASCVAIIVVSKFLGKVWLMRREDYYDS